jgi:4-hydroxythreonine-4-phosphate dehydrogenase
VQLLAGPQPGKLDGGNAQYVYECIKTAATECLSGRYTAMVTGPVHKGIINDAGIRFSGHTELIAELCAVDKPVMMLANQDLRVALITTHLPLREVPDAITSKAIYQVIQVVQHDLKSRFNILSPRILVCGLNPHAGEDGHLGHEEIEIITPCLDSLRKQSMDVIGPIPADTAFTPQMLAQADVVIAMYHDQGLPIIKAAGFGETVNITLGLPIVRTSVDHGTALSLAGTGTAESSSLLAAIEIAQISGAN